MITARHVGRLVAALAVAVLVVPGAAVAQDLRSPDTRDAAATSAVATSTARDLRSPDTADLASRVTAVAPTDLRTPDAQDAATATLAASLAPSDLRTPDAVDAASGRQVVSNPIVVVKPAADTFDWGDAAIGAAAALALVAVGGAVALLVRRRTRRPVTTAPAGVATRHGGRVRRGSRSREHAGMR